MNALQEVIGRAISPSAVKPDGNYTSPKSYGVYGLPEGASGRSFRFGNHPVRMHELQKEYGSCKLEYLFLKRSDAKEVADHLVRADSAGSKPKPTLTNGRLLA